MHFEPKGLLKHNFHSQVVTFWGCSALLSGCWCCVSGRVVQSAAAEWVDMCGAWYSCWVSGHVWCRVQLLSEWTCAVQSAAAEWVDVCGAECDCWVSGCAVQLLSEVCGAECSCWVSGRVVQLLSGRAVQSAATEWVDVCGAECICWVSGHVRCRMHLLSEWACAAEYSCWMSGRVQSTAADWVDVWCRVQLLS